MRILTIVSDLGFGGTQRTAQNYAVAYRESGHKSAVFAWREGGQRAQELRDKGVKLFVAASEGASLEDALEWHPDVVHIHRPGSADPVTGALLRRVRDRLGERVAVIETNVFARVDYSPDRTLIDVHCILSQWCLWKWSRWARGLRPPPVGVIVPNMVCHEGFGKVSASARAEFRRKYAICEDATVFLRVGSPISSKWHPLMIEAFAEFAGREPRAWLVMVGCPAELRPRLDLLPVHVRRRVVDIPLLVGTRRCGSATARVIYFFMPQRSANRSDSFCVKQCCVVCR